MDRFLKALSFAGKPRRWAHLPLLSFSIVPWVCYRSGAEDLQKAGTFKVTVLPSELPADLVKIDPFFTEPFGSGGDWSDPIKHSAGSHDFLIRVGKSETLRAIIYCSGYDFATISVPSLASSSHQASVTMKRLPMIRLSDQILSYKTVSLTDPVVCIDYLASWGMRFLGYSAGMVPKFKVAVVPLSPDGSFSAEIPDLTHVLLDTPSGSEAATLQFSARSKKTNILLWLSPKNDRTLSSGLKIKAFYDQPTLFTIEPR
jgi:hypothetical protein